jgi:hypothetical protein
MGVEKAASGSSREFLIFFSINAKGRGILAGYVSLESQEKVRMGAECARAF